MSRISKDDEAARYAHTHNPDGSEKEMQAVSEKSPWWTWFTRQKWEYPPVVESTKAQIEKGSEMPDPYAEEGNG